MHKGVKGLVVGIGVSMIICGILYKAQIGPFKKDAPVQVQTTIEDIDGVTDFTSAAKEVEKKNAVNEQIKEQLVEQGYPEETVDELLAQGAQKVTALPNIASVLEKYGTPWNLPFFVDEYELVSLYIVGNTESEKFVLGQYEDSTEEHVIFVHMSTQASLNTLRAGLVYSSEQKEEKYTAYCNETGAIVGFQFSVELLEGKGVANYVATGSGTFTQSAIDSFIGSVVDGTIQF